MGINGRPETSLNSYKSTLHNIPEERSSHSNIHHTGAENYWAGDYNLTACSLTAFWRFGVTSCFHLQGDLIWLSSHSHPQKPCERTPSFFLHYHHCQMLFLSGLCQLHKAGRYAAIHQATLHRGCSHDSARTRWQPPLVHRYFKLWGSLFELRTLRTLPLAVNHTVSLLHTTCLYGTSPFVQIRATTEAIYYKGNIEKHWRNHCCRGKTVNHILIMYL